MQKTPSLTQGSVYKTLIRFAIPFMLSNLLQVLYGACDLFVVGRFATTADVSAVSVGSQVMSMLTHMILGLTAGATVLLAQYTGAKKGNEIGKAVGTAISLFSAIALGLTVVLVGLVGPIVSWVNTPAEAVSAAQDYMMICSLGTVFVTGYNVVSSILRGLGDSKTPLIFVGIACVCNMVLDIVLVAVFHMGAAGAAIATVFSQGISLLFSVLYLRKKGLGYPFKKKDLRIQGAYVRKIFGLGLPVALQDTLVGLSFLLITVIINGMGLAASAAVGVVEKLIGFLMLPAIAFGAAVAAMSAQNFGAGKPDRAWRCGVDGMMVSVACGVIVTVLCQMFGLQLTSLFTPDKEVATLAAQYLSTYSIDCIMVGFVFNLNGYFNGCGRSIFSMAHSLATTFALRIPLSLLISRMPGVTLTMMGWGAPISTFVSLILCAIYLVWLHKNPQRLSQQLS